jgi:hypothetical protein
MTGPNGLDGTRTLPNDVGMGILDDAAKARAQAEADANAAAKAAVEELRERLRRDREERDVRARQLAENRKAWEEKRRLSAEQELRQLLARQEERKRDRQLAEDIKALEQKRRLSEEEGRRLSQEFLSEVRARHLEPNHTWHVVTAKREWVRDSRSGTWGWSEKEVISRVESGKGFKVGGYHIDPATGQELVTKTTVETRPAEKRWIGRSRPKTEIYTTSVVQRPLMNHPGLVDAMLDFLGQAEGTGHR